MPTSISDLMTYKVPTYTVDDAIRTKLKIFKHYIKTHSTTTIHVVEINKAYMHIGDLYGYLLTVGIDSYLHWAILLLSDINNPTDFNQNTKVLYIPDIALLEALIQ